MKKLCLLLAMTLAVGLTGCHKSEADTKTETKQETSAVVDETAEDVINEIAKKYENLRKGIGDVMGGAILDTNARRILNQGRAEGRAEGRVEGIADMTISLLEDIGEVPEALSKIIYEQNDINILEKWHKTAAKAKSIEEFEQKIGLVEK